MKIASEFIEDRKKLETGTTFNGKPCKPVPGALRGHPVFHGYVRALYHLLANRDFLLTGLARLEAELTAWIGGGGRAAKAIDYFGQWKERIGAKDESADPKFKGALSGVLAASQARHGFAVEHRVTIASTGVATGGFANIKAFANLQKTSQHFKDLNAGPEHGEFTHQIQWYIISELWNAVQQEAERMFTYTYGYEFGEHKHFANAGALMAYVGKTGLSAVGIWNLLFDRVKDETVGVYTISKDPDCKFDGRCPEVLHLSIFTRTREFPLLANFLKGRYAKREAERQNEAFSYLKQKVGKPGVQPINELGFLETPKK
ncbi:LirA/MavJ family T4SS effector [Corallococcus terminator]|uniref:DUF5636 domain-containing protein n=1 Tax=Corallococcus terminator TaxID=2316733 RepID=A0A3A8JR93_9BACT|nr:LirA/MavJ family T4SS effector [Corallococcus terminator]RKG92183.1 hypothetical protein D7V88_07000 [Corallococcus terminator]